MNTALIGHTGFVGGNLIQQTTFQHLYNSKNFMEMKNQSYDLLVCAGVSAVKWKANKEPEADRASIKALEDILATVTAKHMVLISTIDVYPVSSGADESFDCASMDNHAYGSHRLAFEAFCCDHFQNCSVVRLPGLFGPGLKKNVIFDLLNDNCLEMINSASSFQYYDLRNLWNDIQVVLNSDVDLVNLFTEAVPTSTILNRFFPDKDVGAEKVAEAHYDLHTQHANLWGKQGKYLQGRSEVLDALADYLRSVGHYYDAQNNHGANS